MRSPKYLPPDRNKYNRNDSPCRSHRRRVQRSTCSAVVTIGSPANDNASAPIPIPISRCIGHFWPNQPAVKLHANPTIVLTTSVL